MTAPDPDLRLGHGLLVLLIDPQRWLYRRVETIRFVGEDQIRRHISVDIDAEYVASLADVPAAVASSCLVPLALLEKRPLALLDVVDESDRTLPVLGTEQNGYAAYSVLVSCASIVFDCSSARHLDASLLLELENIAYKPAAEATQALQRIRSSSSPSWRKVYRDPFFRKLAEDLCDNFLLLILVTYGSQQAPRRIIKFSFAIELDRSQSGRGWKRSLAIAEQTFMIDLPSIGDGASCHVQIVPPVGVMVGAIQLYTMHTFVKGRRQVINGSHVAGIGHVNSARVTSGSSAEIMVTLAASPRGSISAAATASGIIAILLIGLAVLPESRLVHLESGVSPVPAVLLAVPTLVAVYLANPGETSLLSRILRRMRLLLLVSSVCAFAGSLAFVLSFHGGSQRALLISIAAVATVCAVMLSIARLRCRQIGRKRQVFQDAEKWIPNMKAGWNQAGYIRIRSAEGARNAYPDVPTPAELRSLTRARVEIAVARFRSSNRTVSVGIAGFWRTVRRWFQNSEL